MNITLKRNWSIKQSAPLFLSTLIPCLSPPKNVNIFLFVGWYKHIKLWQMLLLTSGLQNFCFLHFQFSCSNYKPTIMLIRSYLLMNIPEEGETKLTDAKLQGYAAVLSIGSTQCKANILGMLKNDPEILKSTTCASTAFSIQLLLF